MRCLRHRRRANGKSDGDHKRKKNVRTYDGRQLSEEHRVKIEEYIKGIPAQIRGV